jgi:dolichol kinase
MDDLAFEIFTFGTFCFMSRIVEMLEGRLSSKNWAINDNLVVSAGVMSYVFYFMR